MVFIYLFNITDITRKGIARMLRSSSYLVRSCKSNPCTIWGSVCVGGVTRGALSAEKFGLTHWHTLLKFCLTHWHTSFGQRKMKSLNHLHSFQINETKKMNLNWTSEGGGFRELHLMSFMGQFKNTINHLFFFVSLLASLIETWTQSSLKGKKILINETSHLLQKPPLFLLLHTHANLECRNVF